MTSPHPPNPLSRLPAVGQLLEQAEGLVRTYGHAQTADALRAVLDDARTAVRAGAQPDISPVALVQQAGQHLERRSKPTLRPVINATGVIIHTNLGRAPLARNALEAMSAAGGQYNTLEYDLSTGGRGSRNIHPNMLLCDLTGAEAAHVVNNAAAALVLALAALTAGQEVIVSRGQAVEIGGGFRIPEIMKQSGTQLVEVGTTNKTRIADYANALTENTAALLRVHTANFKQVGFTEAASLAQMAQLAAKHNVLLIDDLGSGALLDTAQFGLSPEPLVQASIEAGADVVLFSGDKLLGAPQAGILLGKQDVIQQLQRHPLSRALRADKVTLAGLVATLAHYRRGDALEQVPVWWMMGRSLCDLGRIAKRWSKQIPGSDIQKGFSTVGGGSVPGTSLPTVLLALDVPHPNALLDRLRENDPPVIARIADDRALLDPRTVFPEQEDALLAALDAAL